MAARAREWEATAVGGLTMGADAPACAALAGGADVKAFFVRKETKQHGLQRRIEGPLLDPGDRCLIVEDVVTTGGSTLQAIEAVREAGHPIVGVVTVLDRLAGGAERIREAAGGAPYEALATIDDVYPERPDRGSAGGAARACMPRAGFEPAAYSLGGSRSIQLSYRGPAERIRRQVPRRRPLTDRYAQRPTVRHLALRDGRRRPPWSESTQRPAAAVSAPTGVESRRAGMTTRPHLGEGPISEVQMTQGRRP